MPRGLREHVISLFTEEQESGLPRAPRELMADQG